MTLVWIKLAKFHLKYPYFDENELYHIENVSLDDTKQHLEWCKRSFECKPKNTYKIETQNGMILVHDNKVNNIDEWNLLHCTP